MPKNMELIEVRKGVPLAFPVRLKMAELLAVGKTNEEIAAELGISERTVIRYRAKEETRLLVQEIGTMIAHSAGPMAADFAIKTVKTGNDVITKAQNMSDEPAWKTLYNDKGEPKDFIIDREKTNYLEANRNVLAITEKISSKVLQSMGLLPALAPSVFVQNIFNFNPTTVIAPELVALFSPESLAQIQGSSNEGVLDIEAEWTELAGGEE